MGAEPSHEPGGRAPEPAVEVVLHSRGYLALLLVAALIGIPISVIAFGFLAAVHELEHLVWDTLPAELGYDHLPAWWPIVTIGLAGVLVGLAVKHLPGHGGHVPAMGMAAGATPPSALPGVLLAASAGLVLGAVVGPEAPLIVLGSGLALLAVAWAKTKENARTSAAIGATGSAAAISAIFGNPLVAAVIFLEVVGLGRRQTMLVLLPCLVSSGVGALVFTGLGNWTGLEIGALAIPDLQPARLVLADVAWAIPLAALVAVATWSCFGIGRRIARLASTHLMATTVAAGLLAGCSAALYAVTTGHSPAEVALSGQATLAPLAAHPGSWSVGALVMLLVCKGLAYALCLGTFRGGPIFPAILIGAVFGVLADALFPGIGTVAGLAIGMAAGVAVTGLPITSVLLVTLLLGDAATRQMPVVILAAVTALVVEEMLSSWSGRLTESVPGT
jgi:H+/Cl- antiporter ClcA